MSLNKTVYQCMNTECGHTFKDFDGYEDDPNTRDCPKCHNSKGRIALLGRKASFSVVSDDLGINGIMNPVDGKAYSSKSQYYKKVKAAGMEIAGNDAKAETKREIQGDYDCRKDIAQAIEQTGAMEKLKRKK